MDGPLEEAVLAKDDPEEDFIDADDTIDERSEEEILKEILNRGGVPSRPSHHIVRDNEIESLKQGLADLGLLYLSILINTQYMTNSTLVSPVKMEYGCNFSIFGLKMMMKSGLGKIFLKFLLSLTMSFLLLNFDQKYKFSNKMTW